MTHLPLPQVEHELKLGLKSKIEETEAMWHLLNTMFKNVEREFRYVDAILKSLEANGEQGEKQGLGAVTAACLELKMRKVRDQFQDDNREKARTLHSPSLVQVWFCS